MKLSDLAPYKHHQASISPQNLWVKTVPDEIQQAAVTIGRPSQTSSYQDAILDLKASGGGDGMWVPYQASASVYGYLDGGQTWAASGPYSGCYFVVGKHAGKTFVAHVSCENKNDSNVAAWEKSEFAKNILFKKKIGMATSLPMGSVGAAAIVFANVSSNSIEVTRVDIRTTSPGEMSGLIFNVTKLDSD
jgi:hypothetical protein